jgi:hypothetical protein
MQDAVKPALDMLTAQLAELETILEQAQKDLNTVAAGERLVKWKIKAVPLIARHLGQREAKRFEDTRPGPSFSNDLLEELSDDVELYRDYLTALAVRIKSGGLAGGGS